MTERIKGITFSPKVFKGGDSVHVDGLGEGMFVGVYHEDVAQKLHEVVSRSRASIGHGPLKAPIKRTKHLTMLTVDVSNGVGEPDVKQIRLGKVQPA